MAKLTSAQIRKIIKAHNIEATVKIPTGLKQNELEKFVESKGFTINHDEKSISKGGKKITLEQAEKVTKPKADAGGTALQKLKTQERKQEKVIAQKKKERELKKEAVKKATKNLVPKTSVPKKVGSKPVPKKEEPKKGKKAGDKFILNEQAKEVQKKILERKKKKELEARKPKRKQLGETKKASGSAVVQPGKPEGLQIKKQGKKKGDKFILNEQAKEVQKKILERKKKKVEAIKVIKGKKKSINLEPTDKTEKSNEEGWKKYFKMVEDNKELLRNNEMAPPFRDSYSFYKTNANVRDGQSNMNNKWSKWIEMLEKKIKEIKEKKPEKKKTVVKNKKPKPQPKKLKKDLKQDIEGGVELEETGMAEKDKMPKDRCKDYVYASKKIIQADKDNFKKVRLFDKDASSWIDSFGRRFKTPTPLLKLYEVFENVSNWDDTIDLIKKDCGVQETLFVETAYDIMYRKWDKVKDAIVKQNVKNNPDIASKLKKSKQIEYQYYEPKN
jgi:hypothetical protein